MELESEPSPSWLRRSWRSFWGAKWYGMSRWAIWGTILGFITLISGVIVFSQWGNYCDGETIGSGRYSYCLGDSDNPNTVERNAAISLMAIGVVLSVVCVIYIKVQFWRYRWVRKKREPQVNYYTNNYANDVPNDYDYANNA